MQLLRLFTRPPRPRRLEKSFRVEFTRTILECKLSFTLSYVIAWTYFPIDDEDGILFPGQYPENSSNKLFKRIFFDYLINLQKGSH